jgi:hypothetical protein
MRRIEQLEIRVICIQKVISDRIVNPRLYLKVAGQTFCQTVALNRISQKIAQPQTKGDNRDNVKDLFDFPVHGNVIVGQPKQKSDND